MDTRFHRSGICVPESPTAVARVLQDTWGHICVFFVTFPFLHVSDSGTADNAPDDPDAHFEDVEDARTLYNTPAWETGEAPSDDDTVGLRLSLPDERAQRLKAVAKQLGLAPSTVAKRAIEMVCEEVITTHSDQTPPHLHVEQYQARLDLLHAVKDTEIPSVVEDDDDPSSADESDQDLTPSDLTADAPPAPDADSDAAVNPTETDE